jgi:hypothetical protein
MSEDGEMWAAIRADGQEKRWKNHDRSLMLLEAGGIVVRKLNAETGHYRVGDFDFWPTTGKFYNQKTKLGGRGVFNLLKLVKKAR